MLEHSCRYKVGEKEMVSVVLSSVVSTAFVLFLSLFFSFLFSSACFTASFRDLHGGDELYANEISKNEMKCRVEKRILV
jgi:hypothetical protein